MSNLAQQHVAPLTLDMRDVSERPLNDPIAPTALRKIALVADDSVMPFFVEGTLPNKTSVTVDAVPPIVDRYRQCRMK